MGVFISQMRLAEINNYRNELEYKIQLISTTKLSLSSQINDMVGLGSDMDPDSPEMKALEQKKERLAQAEKALDQQQQRYQTQLEMVEQEEQKVRENLSKAIQRCA